MKKKMAINARDLAQRWQQMSVRERAMVLVTTSVLLIALWYELLVVTLMDTNSDLQRKVTAAATAIKAQQTEQQQVLEAYRGDPNTKLEQQIAAVQLELAALTADLSGMTSGLVPPEHMPQLLNDVMQRHPGVRLVRAENLAPDRLVARVRAEPDGSEEAGPDVAFYRHGLRMELQGGYSDVVAWLASMEAMPWEFVWQSLRYEVQEHPLARVTVEVQTVSTEDRWIGITGDST